MLLNLISTPILTLPFFKTKEELKETHVGVLNETALPVWIVEHMHDQGHERSEEVLPVDDLGLAHVPNHLQLSVVGLGADRLEVVAVVLVLLVAAGGGRDGAALFWFSSSRSWGVRL